MLTRLSPRGLKLSLVPWHTLAVATFPVLFLFAENADQQVTLIPLWRPLLLCFAGGAALLLVMIVATRSLLRGGLLATLLLVLFFSFGHLWNVVGAPMDASRWLMAAGYLLIGIGLGLLIWRGGRWVTGVSRFLNIAAVALLLFNALRVADFASASSAAAGTMPTSPPVSVEAPATRPDVYYIILDRYANVDTLRDIYHFDNEPFMRALEDRGFSVARHAWANYFKTALSVYTSMNMHYIDPEQLGVDMSQPSRFREIQGALRDHLALPVALKSLGYDYLQIGGWWEPTATNIDADLSLRFQGSAEFANALWSTTALSLIWPPAFGGTGPDGESMPFRDLARETITYAFDQLEATADRSGPDFVFAHITVPHPPYVFNADGSFPTHAEVDARSERDSYVAQLQWANQRVLRAIDNLMDHDPDEPDPIIVLQADEGPFPPGFSADEAGFQWLEASPREIQQKYGILNAMRLPGVDPASVGFTDHTSPVNEFRIVLDAYFDANLPLLPDLSYLSPDYSRFYDFVPYPHPDD
jgi:Sulfatase